MTVHPSTLPPPTDPRDPGYPADDPCWRGVVTGPIKPLEPITIPPGDPWETDTETRP